MKDGEISLLQFPINVYPNSHALDGETDNTFSFVFHGDILTKYQIVIYKNITADVVYTGAEIETTKYNEDTISTTIPTGTFANGLDLVWTIKLWDSNGNTVTSPNYFFKSRTTPIISVTSTTSPHASRKIELTGTYSQAQNTPIRYHTWNLYDDTGSVIDTTGKVYSSNIKYSFDGLLSGQTYGYSLTVINQDNVTIESGTVTFSVAYPAPDISVPPKVSFLPDKNAALIEWSADRQSIGTATGEYEFVSDYPFEGATSVKIKSGEILYNTVSGNPLSLISDNFSVIAYISFDDTKQGDMIEVTDSNNNKYHLSINDYTLISSKNNITNLLKNIFPTVVSGQTVTGIPEVNTGYIWDDSDVWDDSKYWTEPLPFTKKIVVIIKPSETLITEIT